MASGSILKRYFFKVLSSGISGVYNFIILTIFPRLLGAVSFGEYSYVYNFFMQSIMVLESGASNGLYTKLSVNRNKQELLAFTTLFCVTVLGLVCVVSAGIYFSPIGQYVWPSIPGKVVLLGLIYCAALWSSTMLLQVSDAYGLTIKTEKIRIVHRLIFFGMLPLFTIFFVIHLYTFLYYQLFYVFSYVAFLWCVLRYNQVKLFQGITHIHFKENVTTLYRLCAPLYVFNVLFVLGKIFDVWLLQTSSGSRQQGYYGFAFELASVSLLFSASLIPIIMREFSITHHNRDFDALRSLFNRYVPAFYFITLTISVYIAFHAHLLIHVMGGGAYQQAFWVVVILAFYPIYETFLRINCALFYASERTSIYRNIGVICLTFGIVLTFFMLAPASLYGLHLGAMGLAIKIMVFQCFFANICLFVNMRYLNMNYFLFLLKTVMFLGITILIGFIAQLSGSVGSLFLFPVIVLGVVLCLPQFFLGFSHSQLKQVVFRLRGKVHESNL